MMKQQISVEQNLDTILNNAVNDYFEHFKIKDQCALKQLIDHDDKYNTDYFLITGQSFVNWMLPYFKLNQTDSKLSQNFDRFINDIDIFSLKRIMTFRRGIESINTPDLDNYGRLINSSYSIMRSTKIEIEHRLYNFIDIQSLLFRFNFDGSDIDSERAYAALDNVLGFFDINLNQIGACYNAKTDEIKLIYTDSFEKFLKSNQIELNPRNTHLDRIYRLYYKFDAINDLNLAMLFHDAKKLKFNVFVNLEEFKLYIATFMKLIKQAEILYQDNSDNFKSFERDMKLELSKLIYSKYKIGLRTSTGKTYSRLVDEISSGFTIDYDKNNVNYSDSIGMHFTEEFKKIIDFTEIKYISVENYINLSYSSKTGHDARREIFSQLHLATISEISLQRMSQNKLETLVKYLEKRGYDNIPLVYLILVDQPKLLNRNVSDFYRVFSNLVHFDDIFQKHYDAELVFDFILDILNLIEIISKDNAKSLNITKKDLINTMFGVLESDQKYLSYLEDYILSDKKTDKIYSALLEDFKTQVKDKLLTDLIKFPRIVVKDDEGHTIEELIQGFELKSEGSYLNHCVGGYVRAVELGRSIIARIYKNSPFTSENKQNFRYTVELSYDEITNDFRTVQIRGYSNRSMAYEHSEIILPLIDKFKSKLLESKDRIKFHTRSEIDDPDVPFWVN